jgi:hypothetical protein
VINSFLLHLTKLHNSLISSGVTAAAIAAAAAALNSLQRPRLCSPINKCIITTCEKKPENSISASRTYELSQKEKK